jgi:hypothetical protein
MNYKEYGRKRRWPNMRLYHGICVEEMRKTTEALRIAGLLFEL